MENLRLVPKNTWDFFNLGYSLPNRFTTPSSSLVFFSFQVRRKPTSFTDSEANLLFKLIQVLLFRAQKLSHWYKPQQVPTGLPLLLFLFLPTSQRWIFYFGPLKAVSMMRWGELPRLSDTWAALFSILLAIFFPFLYVIQVVILLFIDM
ncbi:hypothetical protein Taro_040924 [Colocasia esculenta]|uniref:Uncharacterized protein n=1 Tax=Colocasia esculenta TaxID=4460 RepID=A0A843WD20_COLES|nr:hypothetical protein [Colocasia esculenta]